MTERRKVLSFLGTSVPDATPLALEDYETVVAVVSPDAAHTLRVAESHLMGGDTSLAVMTLASKLAVADLRCQDAEAVISVLLTHVTNYAEAVAAGLIDVEAGEKQALARVLPFVLDQRPKSTLADLCVSRETHGRGRHRSTTLNRQLKQGYMGDDAISADGTVLTVRRPAARPTCDYCHAPLPAARNHNGEVRRFCPGNRCRSGWHAREKRRSLEHAREALRAALVALDGLLTRK